MRDFFKGRRRKIGCAALVMACVLMGLWLRSVRCCDSYCFVYKHSVITIRSVDNWFGCRIGWHPDTAPLWYPDLDIGWTSQSGADTLGDSIADGKWNWPRPAVSSNGVDIHFHWEMAGFGFYSATFHNAERLNICRIPDWSFVLPLTLLSAFLLLDKNKTSTTKNITEPAVNEGAI